jgi:zinc transport system permease protein
MTDLLDALQNIPFFRYALLAGLLASVSLGIVGSYVVTRRITYIAAAISQCVLGGIGAALYLQKVVGWEWCDPIGGALVAAIISAIIIGLVSLYARQREDTVISAVWAVGMAIGLVFFAKTPGYVDAMSYLFGNILLISARDVWLALCFDEEFAALRGVRVKLYYLLLLCLTALTVVLLVRVVGIVLVIALMTLPAAVAGHFARQLWQMMAVAVLCSMAFVTTGIAVSFPANFPSGPVIILIAGATYLLVAFFSRGQRSGARGQG